MLGQRRAGFPSRPGFHGADRKPGLQVPISPRDLCRGRQATRRVQRLPGLTRGKPRSGLSVSGQAFPARHRLSSARERSGLRQPVTQVTRACSTRRIGERGGLGPRPHSGGDTRFAPSHPSDHESFLAAPTATTPRGASDLIPASVATPPPVDGFIGENRVTNNHLRGMPDGSYADRLSSNTVVRIRFARPTVDALLSPPPGCGGIKSHGYAIHNSLYGSDFYEQCAQETR